MIQNEKSTHDFEMFIKEGVIRDPFRQRESDCAVTGRCDLRAWRRSNFITSRFSVLKARQMSAVLDSDTRRKNGHGPQTERCVPGRVQVASFWHCPRRPSRSARLIATASSASLPWAGDNQKRQFTERSEWRMTFAPGTDRARPHRGGPAQGVGCEGRDSEAPPVSRSVSWGWGEV